MRDNPHYLLYYAYGKPIETMRHQGPDMIDGRRLPL